MLLCQNVGANSLLKLYVPVLCFRNIDCSADASLQGFSGYFSTGRQAEADQQGQDESLNELNHNSCLRLELGGNYPYTSYALNLQSEKRFKPGSEVNLQEGPVGYQINSFQPPKLDYDANMQTWASTSGSCGVGMLDDQSYPQVLSLISYLYFHIFPSVLSYWHL